MNQQVFAIKVKKNQIESEHSIPLHKEFTFVKVLENGDWQVKNTQTSQTCVVKKKEEGKFIVYDFVCNSLR